MSPPPTAQPSQRSVTAPVEAALRRFPLVARPRIACPPLTTRLAEIADLAAAHPNDRGDDAQALVAVAHNKAALLASDLGLPDLARTLCWRHHNRYRPIHPWNARLARLALEPLINLARLHIRHARPDDAVTLLTTVWRSVDTGHDTLIDGQPFSTNGLAPGTEEHHTLRTWLWSVTLAEGLRALAAAGRWNDALTYAHHHRGIGHRLLDGRQIAILAHLATGDHDLAAHLIANTDVHEPWERAVAACLTAATNRPGSPGRASAPPISDRYLDVDLDLRHTLFTVRLGLTVIDLTGGPAHPGNLQAVARLRNHARTTTDAYVARELLNHPVLPALSTAEHDHLQRIHVAAHLGVADGNYTVADHILTALDCRLITS